MHGIKNTTSCGLSSLHLGPRVGGSVTSVLHFSGDIEGRCIVHVCLPVTFRSLSPVLLFKQVDQSFSLQSRSYRSFGERQQMLCT